MFGQADVGFTPAEVELLGEFLGVELTDKAWAESAVRDHTYANDRGLADNYIRAAWLGDRVLNLVLADRTERDWPPMRTWAGTEPQREQQSRARAAAIVAEQWPAEVRALLRLGNTWRDRSPDPSMWAAFAEALVGVAFREGGYPAARRFVERWWPAAEPPLQFESFVLELD